MKNLPKHWLETEFKRRKAKNSQYSLRAYANFLKIPPGRLSEFLSGKRKICGGMAMRLADQLGLSPKQKQLWALSFSKKQYEPKLFYSLDEDTYAALAECQHFALLSLMDTVCFRSDISWIARRLKVSSLDVREMLDRLERLQLIKRNDGEIWRTEKNLQSTNEISSAALRKMHKQILEQTIEKIETIPLEERDITSMTLAIDLKKLPVAKKLIREFRRKLGELLESGISTEVYHFNIQLVPITTKEEKYEKNN